MKIMKFNSKLFPAVLVFSLMSLMARAQVVITVQTDSVVNTMAAGFGANTFAMLDSVAVVTT